MLKKEFQSDLLNTFIYIYIINLIFKNYGFFFKKKKKKKFFFKKKKINQ